MTPLDATRESADAEIERLRETPGQRRMDSVTPTVRGRNVPERYQVESGVS